MFWHEGEAEIGTQSAPAAFPIIVRRDIPREEPGDGFLRTAAIPRAARQDGRMGEDHGGGDHSVPGVEGGVITGSFRGETDESVYVWIRRFESEAQRAALYQAVYDSDHWKTKIAPRVPECLDREKMVVTRILPTRRSPAQ